MAQTPQEPDNTDREEAADAAPQAPARRAQTSPNIDKFTQLRLEQIKPSTPDEAINATPQTRIRRSSVTAMLLLNGFRNRGHNVYDYDRQGNTARYTMQFSDAGGDPYVPLRLLQAAGQHCREIEREKRQEALERAHRVETENQTLQFPEGTEMETHADEIILRSKQYPELGHTLDAYATQATLNRIGEELLREEQLHAQQLGELTRKYGFIVSRPQDEPTRLNNEGYGLEEIELPRYEPHSHVSVQGLLAKADAQAMDFQNQILEVVDQYERCGISLQETFAEGEHEIHFGGEVLEADKKTQQAPTINWESLIPSATRLARMTPRRYELLRQQAASMQNATPKTVEEDWDNAGTIWMANQNIQRLQELGSYCLAEFNNKNVLTLSDRLKSIAAPDTGRQVMSHLLLDTLRDMLSLQMKIHEQTKSFNQTMGMITTETDSAGDSHYQFRGTPVRCTVPEGTDPYTAYRLVTLATLPAASLIRTHRRQNRALHELGVEGVSDSINTFVAESASGSHELHLTHTLVPDAEFRESTDAAPLYATDSLVEQKQRAAEYFAHAMQEDLCRNHGFERISEDGAPVILRYVPTGEEIPFPAFQRDKAALVAQAYQAGRSVDEKHKALEVGAGQVTQLIQLLSRQYGCITSDGGKKVGSPQAININRIDLPALQTPGAISSAIGNLRRLQSRLVAHHELQQSVLASLQQPGQGIEPFEVIRDEEANTITIRGRNSERKLKTYGEAGLISTADLETLRPLSRATRVSPRDRSGSGQGRGGRRR